MNFQIRKSQNDSCEAKIIAFHCALSGEKTSWRETPLFAPDTIPFGGVDFVQEFYGKHFVPDYFPDFLAGFVRRKTWRVNSYEELPLGETFVKPADKYKRFCGQLLHKKSNLLSSKKKTNPKYNGPYVCSEVVNFSSEWRVYVVGGKVLCAHYYTDTEGEPPAVEVAWPENYCGAVDFGILNGVPELIEAHHPFSIGWYGGFGAGEDYIKFLKAGHSFCLDF